MLKTSLIFVLYTISHIAKGEDGNCNLLGTIFYEGAGCDPVTPEGSPCPTQYNCSFLKLSPDYCLIRGEKKEIGYYEGGASQCHCVAPGTNDNKGDFADFICSTECSLCPEHHGIDLAENCHLTYELGQRCSAGQICVTEENKDSVAKCEVNGITYKEGQKFRLDRSCADCICKKGFNGTASPEFCTRDTCKFRNGDYENLQNNCARVYPKHVYSGCWNVWWFCPKDIIGPLQINAAPTENDSDLKCVFGDKKFVKGQSFVVVAKNIECKCELPPLMFCTPL